MDNDCDGTTDEDPIDPDLTTPTSLRLQRRHLPAGHAHLPGRGQALRGRGGAAGRDLQRPGRRLRRQHRRRHQPARSLPGARPAAGHAHPRRVPPGHQRLRPDPASPAAPASSARAGVGPAAELCDGMDNDCDGQIDDSATCPAGQGCADGECVARCGGAGDAACPADRLCREGLCRFAECVRTPCQPGFRCDAQPRLRRPLRGGDLPGRHPLRQRRVHQLPGARLRRRRAGRERGEVCRGETACPTPAPASAAPTASSAATAPAWPAAWASTAATARSAATASAWPIAAPARSCPPGPVLRSRTSAQCAADPCASISCLPGPGLRARHTAACVDDPCQVTSCPAGQACRVRPDGQSECRCRARGRSAGGGCACEVGAAPAQGSAAPGSDRAAVAVRACCCGPAAAGGGGARAMSERRVPALRAGPTGRRGGAAGARLPAAQLPHRRRRRRRAGHGAGARRHRRSRPRSSAPTACPARRGPELRAVAGDLQRAGRRLRRDDRRGLRAADRPGQLRPLRRHLQLRQRHPAVRGRPLPLRHLRHRPRRPGRRAPERLRVQR